MKVLPNTGIIAPTTDDVAKKGIDGLETARFLIEQSFDKLDDILGGMNETVIRDVEFDNTTEDGDLVYIRENGVYAPALAEESVRKNVAGVADTVNRRVIFIGHVKYKGEVGNFKAGDYLYLSPRYQGKAQSEAPLEAPEVLVGLYLGNRSVLINLTTAISDYLQKGIPDGSIGTEKLGQNVVSPFAKEITYGEGLPKAGEVGQLGLLCPEYEGDLNGIAFNSHYQISADKVLNRPVDFDLETCGVIDTRILKDGMACQTLWSVSDTDNLIWYRKKYGGRWQEWSPLTGVGDQRIEKEIFYNTLLLGSQYQYCYYDVLDNAENVEFDTLAPSYDMLNKRLIFNNANQSIYFSVVSGNKYYQGFKVFLPEVDESLYSISYTVNNRTYKETARNKDNLDTYDTLKIKITSRGGFILEHFGVLYKLENKYHTDSDAIVMRDYETDRAYKLGINRGTLVLTALG